MDIKQGQTWLNKRGQMVHVVEILRDADGESAGVRDAGPGKLRARYWVNQGTGVSLLPDSKQLDLVEQVSRIYIAGPMTGLPELNFPAFNAAAAELRKRGAWVENPAEINAACDITWEDAMRADIPRLMTCDSLYLLPGWQQSRGAAIEHDLAVALKMTITYPITE